jgi:GxxExxY protein
MLLEAPFNATTKRIIDAAVEVHRTIGPGLLESTYLECLHCELSDRRIRFDRQRTIPLVYKGRPLVTTYRVDLVVEDIVIVEVKSQASTLAIHEAQVITYLKLTGCPVGLLINFNVTRLMDGVRRLINPNLRHTWDARRNDKEDPPLPPFPPRE